jgi:hypothetical protein
LRAAPPHLRCSGQASGRAQPDGPLSTRTADISTARQDALGHIKMSFLLVLDVFSMARASMMETHVLGLESARRGDSA